MDWGPLGVEVEKEFEGEPRLTEQSKEPREAMVREVEETIKEEREEEE